MARLMRAAIGTNNIDNCSRVCHSPTSFALRKSFGLSGATGSFADIDDAEVALLLGVNPTQGHPVVGARIKQAALRGCKLITIDPRRIELADYGAIHLAPRPGTNAAVVLGLCHVVRRDGLARRGVRRRPHRRLRGGRRAARRATTPAAVEEITGIPAADLEAAAHLYGEAASGCLLWGLGVTEHKYGSEVVQLLCNLAMMTGKVGRPGSALLPLRGQNNVQGSSDMGALPDTYTAYRSVDDEEVASAFEAAWGAPLSRAEGDDDPADVRRRRRRRAEGDVHLRRGRRPDRPRHRPRRRRPRRASSSSSARRSSRTRRRSSPTSSCPPPPSSKRKGTFTNAERRFQVVEAAIDPPGEARTDFEIIKAVSRRLGHEIGVGDALGRARRDRPPDPALRRRQPRAARPPRPAVAGRAPTAPTRRPSTTRPSTAPAAAATSPPCPTRSPATPPTRSSR